MLATLALLTLSASPVIEVPEAAPVEGVMELTSHGELFLLPEHNAHRFRGLLITQSRERCASIERGMMDVRTYPERWEKMEDLRILDATDKRVKYSYEVDVMFSPRLEGIVEHPGPGHVRFVDERVPSDFSWRLSQLGARCHMVHHMVQPPGVRSDFVKLVQRLEEGTADAAELAGALAASRGWAEPSRPKRAAPSRAAQRAWAALSGAGTTIHLIARPGHSRMLIRAGKRVAAPPAKVLARIRARERYPALGVDFLSDVEQEGRRVEWSVSYFGGRVGFSTAVSERGSLHGPGGMTIHERVTGGDLEEGEWRWTLRAVPGGTEVDLEIDLDVTQGSFVLSTLARQDPLIKRTNALQLALEYMRVLIAYPALPVERVRVATPSKAQ